ncbi:enoyl-CoA hydratase/isomerase family protein [Conexibacter arvalis]|uniref:Enoyl-CoA hydratase n=1 Tax=Conexibacter arvalis TaxID=912552 RepID=A0A840I6U8_9ACTN|nr:enoyl-CoA hydratase/isomerase family protein [Conexibacter arvalis]MBB4660619.1 enoyl-CoA hydratase [Conexibacter arvalis]
MDSLVSAVEDGVYRIELNRPDRLNAIDKPMQRALIAELVRADHDDDSDVIVLAGRGRAFCAGGDIRSLTASDSFRDTRGRVHPGAKHLVNAFLGLEKPIVAEVGGAAVGLGATIALMCDVVVMGESARIGDRHVNVGVVAGDGGAVIWPLLVGPARAKELLMTGRLLRGPEAREIGLVAHCVPDDEVGAKVAELAAELAAQPRWAMRATKVSVNRYLEWMSNLTLDASLALEHLSMTKDEHAQAVEAWLAAQGR